jgi:uncharacterized protein YbcC (UPF0753/DUF2309 family)
MTDRSSGAGAMARANSALARIESHEDLCAERYKSIHETLSELKSDSRTQSRLVVGVLLALLGWMGVQLWNGQVVHPALGETHAAR